MTSPQHPSKQNASSSPKRVNGVKTLMASVSLAATVGGWALLSVNQNLVTKSASVATRTAPSVTATTVKKIDLSPLPTLVPPPTGLGSLSTAAPTAVIPPTVQPQPTLRAVNQPPPQRVVHVGGGDGSSNSSSAPAPAAQTSSSR